MSLKCEISLGQIMARHYSAQNHYPKQCRLIVIWILVNASPWNFSSREMQLKLLCGKSWLLSSGLNHFDVIKWKHFRVTGLWWGESTGHRRIPLTEGQWRGALIFSLVCAWRNGGTAGCHKDNPQWHKRRHRHTRHTDSPYQACISRSSINRNKGAQCS